MTSYDGSVRLHVDDPDLLQELSAVVIEDVAANQWHSVVVRGEVVDVAGMEPGNVVVELVEGPFAGWTAPAVVITDGSTLRIDGSEAFTSPA